MRLFTLDALAALLTASTGTDVQNDVEELVKTICDVEIKEVNNDS